MPRDTNETGDAGRAGPDIAAYSQDLDVLLYQPQTAPASFRAGGRRTVGAIIADAGRLARMGRLDDAGRLVRAGRLDDAAAELRHVQPFIEAGDVGDGYVRSVLERALEDGGEPGGYARDVVAWIMATAADDPAAGPKPGRARPQPTIQVDPGTLPAQVDAAESALIEARLGLHQRGGRIVRIVPAIGRDAHGEDVASVEMADVSEPHLCELLDRAATWEKYDARSRRYVPTDAPATVARAYLARRGTERGLPDLAGIIKAPTIRPDGSVLDFPGYDRPSRLWFDPRGVTFPEIPDAPTDGDVAEALSDLRGLLSGCAFVAPVDEAVALSAILTALVRGSLPAAPMHAFTASAPGTGKSYLARIVTAIAVGQPVGGLAYSSNAEENRKQIDSALIEGRSVILLDNVDADIEGARLAEVLTEPAVTVRPLGRSEVVTVPCTATFLATGNNLVIAADMTRRVLMCRLARPVERPELHRFEHDPLSAIAADRGRYVTAGLTLLRGYISRGQPNLPKPLGSFERWSERVRGALMWAGMPDPVASMDEVRGSDPRRSELLAVLSAWDATIGSRPVTGKEIIDAAVPHPEFRDALLSVAGAGGAINTARLGVWLRKVKGRIAGGLRIEAATMSGGINRWELRGGKAAGQEFPTPSLQEMDQ